MFLNVRHEEVIIPKKAIRYRIIANSNSFSDQEKKFYVNSLIEPILKKILDKSNNIEESRKNIKNNIPKIKSILDTQGIDYNINYGMNYFPKKVYRKTEYNEGNYESLVITLGNGLGDNWWCCLFPPLCLMEATESDLDDLEYSFYIKDIINKYL